MARVGSRCTAPGDEHAANSTAAVLAASKGARYQRAASPTASGDTASPSRSGIERATAPRARPRPIGLPNDQALRVTVRRRDPAHAEISLLAWACDVTGMSDSPDDPRHLGESFMPYFRRNLHASLIRADAP